jgi:hypothetical protein
MDVGNATLETAEPEDYDDSAIGFGLNPDDFAPAICLWDARPSTA